MKKARKAFLSILLVISMIFATVAPAMALTITITTDKKETEEEGPAFVALDLVLETDKDSYTVDEEIEYTITLTNNTKKNATDVRVINFLSAGLKTSDGKMTTAFDDLAPGESASKTVYVAHQTYDNYGNDGIGTALNVISIVFNVFKLVIGKLFASFLPYMCNLDVDMNGQLLGMLSMAFAYESTGEEADDNDDNAEGYAIFIDTNELTYLENEKSYIITEKTSKLSGTVTEVSKISNIKYENKDINGHIIQTENIEIKENWTIDNIGYIVGINNISVYAKYDNGAVYSDKICIINSAEENMEELNLDKGDDDSDGVLNYIEKINNTDSKTSDTDGDKLSDYVEIAILGTNPNAIDTDNDGIADGEEDFDGDTLNNLYEIEIGTSPIYKDSDCEGLEDGIEVQIGTNPTLIDSDEDGVNDYDEYMRNMDPLNGEDQNEIIKTEISSEEVIGKSSDIDVTIDIEAVRKNIETLEITTVSNKIINSSIPGYIGDAYDFKMDGEFISAKLEMEFNEDLLNISNFDPTIYYYNEKTGEFEEIETEVVGNKAIAYLEHFSTYILLNKDEFDKVWDYEIKPPSQENSPIKGLDVVFVIDSSGSMTSNDSNGLRKAVAKKFVEKLGQNDRAAVVDFDSYANLYTGFTSDHTVLNNAINRINSSGGTDLSRGMDLALKQFTDVDYTNTDVYKYIIMLTDGQGSYSSSYTQIAIDNDIVVYTVGLGSGVDQKLLEQIATSTGGKYYFASTSTDLYEIYEKIEDETIDYTTDSNNDGISDYYTELLVNGILRTKTGSRIFSLVTYDEVQSNDDYDGDGLKNGEEIIITTLSNNRIAVEFISSPTQKNTDFDGLDDYQEIKVSNTDPLVFETKIEKNHIDFVLSEKEFVSNKYKEFYDGKFTGPLEKGSIWIGTHIFGTDYDHSMIYKSQFVDYFKSIQGAEDENASANALETAIDYGEQVQNAIEAYVDYKEAVLGIPKDAQEVLKALKDKALSLEDTIKTASNNGFASKEDFYKYIDDLTQQLENTKVEITDFDADIKLNTKLGKVSKVLDAISVVSCVVDCYFNYKEIGEECDRFFSQITTMSNNIYVYEEIINSSADDDIKCVAAELRNALVNELCTTKEQVYKELGYQKQFLTSSAGSVGHTIAGFIPYVKFVEMGISVIDFLFNLSGVAKECLKLNCIATTANVLADDFNCNYPYFVSGEGLNKFINLILARIEAEEQMMDANLENTWLMEAFFKTFVYKQQDIRNNINYMSAFLTLYLIERSKTKV
ncbi:MAG: VWA domain-containing protein [Clostridia bacterium]|nr:VWA domain-containing protein [Clostridia bacterium]